MSAFAVEQVDHVELFVPDQCAAGLVAFLDRLADLKFDTETGATLSRGDWVDHDESLSIYFVDPWHHRFEITTYEVRRAHELLP